MKQPKTKPMTKDIQDVNFLIKTLKQYVPKSPNCKIKITLMASQKSIELLETMCLFMPDQSKPNEIIDPDYEVEDDSAGAAPIISSQSNISPIAKSDEAESDDDALDSALPESPLNFKTFVRSLKYYYKLYEQESPTEKRKKINYIG